jgi:TP901 family phage tail tape measure protein
MANQNEKRVTEFVINGKSAEVSLNQVKKEVLSLTRAFGSLKEADNPKLYKEKAAELRKMTEVYKSMRQQITGAKTDSQKFFDEFKTIATGVLGGNLITGLMTKLSSTINESINKLMELSDEMTNIEKTTNLTNEEVRELDEQLGGIDTRSSRKELREFAVEAGKLGKDSVESVRKFVEEADKINVALGEDLGRDAVTEIMRLADIFGDSALDIGSAINSIGQASVATEAFQVDFLKRTAAIGKAVNITSKELLGYGAALEINGATAETSGTAMLNFFGDFVKKADEFGAIAGYAKGELRKLMDEKGTNAAFIDFLQHLDKGSKNTEDLLKKLEDMGIDGARGANALLILAKNTDDVIQQQKVAAESAGSILAEFEKRNNNAAANAEKALKKLDAALVPIKTSIGGFFIGLFSWLADNIKGIIQFAKVLTVGSVAWGTYKVVVIAGALATRLFSAATLQSTGLVAAQRLALLAGAAAQALFTGNLGRATAAMRVFNTVLRLNPFGLLISAITIAVTGMALFGEETEKLSETQKALKDSTTEAAKSIMTEKNEYERNLKILNDKNNAESVREAALKRMVALNPEWLGGLNMENFYTDEGTLIRNKYNAELLRTAELKAKIAKVDALSGEIEDLRAQQRNDPSSGASTGTKVKNFVGGIFGNPAIAEMNTMAEGMGNLENQIKAKQSAISRLNDDINKLQVKAVGSETFTSPYTGQTYTSEADMKKDEAAKKKAEQEVDKAHIKAKKTAKEIGDDKKKQAEADAEAIAKEYDLSIEYSERKYRFLIAQAAQLRADNEMSEADYQAYVEKLEMDALHDRLLIHKEYGKDLSQVYYDIGVKTAAATQKAQEDFHKNIVQPTGTFGPVTGSAAGGGAAISADDQAKIESAMNYARAANDIMGTMQQIQMHNMEKELIAFEQMNAKKKSVLNKQLEAGVISQEEYNKSIEEMDAAAAQKKRVMMEQQWKNNKQSAIIEATINGILSVTKALTIAPPAGYALAAVNAALSIAQVAAIANQPMPQFYQGGDTWVTGAQDGRRYRARNTRSIAGGGSFSQPTMGLVGERGPEYVIPNYIYGDPKFANVIGALEAARTTRQFGGGGSSTGAPVPGATNTTDSVLMGLTMAVNGLVNRLNEPILAKTYYNLQQFHEADDLEKLAREKGKF